ncbi:MAG: galactose-1-phosphate uridylyltransferase [Granulosicoccaceae bacterium]
MSGNWERRWHPLREEWVIIAAQTGKRPWSGAVVDAPTARAPAHDPGCFLCPRVARASGEQMPDYPSTFAFENDFATLSPTAPDVESDSVLTRREPARGRCRVLCWHPRHDRSLAQLDRDELQAVTQLWRDEWDLLSSDPDIAQVMIFENKGEAVGVSNLHPHGQVYAASFVSDSAQRMRQAQTQYAQAAGNVLLLDLLLQPSWQALQIIQGEHWVAMVPWSARYAYEVWIVPRTHAPHLGALSIAQLAELGDVYQRLVRGYNALFGGEAANITMLHNAPCDGLADNAHWQFHLVCQPPLREPGKLKYLGGFEQSAGNIVNPVQPETAAEHLREVIA